MSTPHNSLQDPMTSCDEFSRMAHQSDIMIDYLDVRRLISKVKRRPGLWDPSSPDYWDREVRRRLWEEIVELLITKEGATNTEKKEFGNIIQKRWKSLKHCYMREYQRLSKLKSNETCLKSPYFYFNHLSFLEPITNKPPMENDEVAEPDDILESGEVDDVPGLHRWSSVSKPYRKRRGPQDSGMSFKRVKHEKEDEDKLFLLSLLSSFKRIPQHLRISVQMELLQVIQSAQHNMAFHYAQIPLMVYQYRYQNPPPVFQAAEQVPQSIPPVLQPSEVAEEEMKPTTQRLVVMHKMTPPSSTSSQNSVSDTEMELYQPSL